MQKKSGLINSFLYMLGGNSAAMLLQLASTFILAFYLSPNDLGVLITGETFIRLFSFFLELGFKDSILKISADSQIEGADFQGNLNKAVGNSLLIKALMSVPLALLIYFVAVLSHLDERILHIAFCYFFIVNIEQFSKVFGTARRALGKFKLIAILNVVNRVNRLIVIFFILDYMKESVEFLVHAFLLFSVLRLILSLVATRHFVQPTIELSSVMPMLKESSKFGLYDFLEQFQVRIDRLMINHFLGPIQVAFYAVPAKINTFTQLIPEVVSQTFTPSMFHAHEQKDLEQFKKMSAYLIRFLTFAGGMIFFIIFYFSDDALVLIYADKFLGSLQVTELFACISLIWFLDKVPSLILATQSKHKERLYPQLFFTLTNIILNFVLITKFGIVGAVYATLSSNLLKLIVIMFFTYAYYNWLLVLAMSLLTVILAWTLPYYLAIPVYLIVAVFAKLVSRQDIEKFLRKI